ncbi:uncharacterized protein LOC115454277 isoform X2 [Manduca sexta]|uniref:uncharacterized protein LOC115454277 isoform X2 n=1 Tax=Manduca sexta TaxID=7130 RepID=UPI00188F82EC|nr:uncharacterized protein LOC115454277 isoform X2 [Manduca sexta]
MLVLLLISVCLKCIHTQQYPRFFDKEDLQELGYLSTHNNPNPVVKQYYDPQPTTVSRTLAPKQYGRAPAPTKRSLPMNFGRTDENYYGSMMSATPDYKPLRHSSTEDIALLEERLTKAGKWYEFIELTNKEKEKYGNKVKPNAYSRSLVEEKPKPKPQKTPLRGNGLPSAGFQMYWSGDEVEKNPNYNKYLEAPQQQSYSNPTYMNFQENPPLRNLNTNYNQSDPGLQNSNPSYYNKFQGDKNLAPPMQYHPRDMPQFLTGKQMLAMAEQKLQKLEPPNEQSASNQSPQTSPQLRNEPNLKKEEEAITPPTDMKVQPQAIGTGLAAFNMSYDKYLPKIDDFGSPIRWVAYNSNETDDGLAKVTDPGTGKNRQFVMNGIVLVPISDSSILRLGYADVSTTPRAQVLTTDGTALRTIIDNMDLKSVDNRDWLAFETVLGLQNVEQKCDVDGCQARCHKSGCDSACLGDTCASGCVGASCNSFVSKIVNCSGVFKCFFLYNVVSFQCKGPGCFSMCIGEECTARVNVTFYLLNLWRLVIAYHDFVTVNRIKYTQLQIILNADTEQMYQLQRN